MYWLGIKEIAIPIYIIVQKSNRTGEYDDFPNETSDAH